MTLQMLGVQVGFRAVRARELAIGVFLRNLVLGHRAGSRGSGSARGAGKDATTTLGANNVGGLLVVGQHRRRHHGALAVRRAHALRGHNAASRHGAENWGDPLARRRCRCNRLGVRHSSRGLGEHARGRCGGIALVGLLVRIRHHVVAAATISGRGGRVVHGARRAGVRVGARLRVRVVAVGSSGLHHAVRVLLVVLLLLVLLLLLLVLLLLLLLLLLQWRQRVLLKALWSRSCRGRVRRSRCAVNHVCRVVVGVHSMLVGRM